MSRYISPVLYVLLMLLGCAAFVSIAGVRVGVLEPAAAFSLLRKTVFAAFALSLLTVVALIVCRNESSAANSRRFFILVGVVSFVYSAMWAMLYLQKSKLPDIYDVTTDLQNPPVFINVGFLRNADEHPLTYNRAWAELQQEAYPDVQPLLLEQNFKQAYVETLALVRERGWDLVAQYPSAGVIEATARTPIFGLRNDVVIRITRQQRNEVRIDMRACSRAGKSDHGYNAELIKSFMGDLERRSAPNSPLAMNLRR
ncbi:DUF1499 domain-containing protein [Marinomonas ostreistagni]|uniref:DUF1499 domain-containing protein n=1 Tax=Marinomonas ostreistagni TaxID=359209 RepID=UPI0019523D48|nr:DUF1499 domain-containing protein [Marinomonas ostreistagni]MBM6550333.1 DUF1499 domain-containing protein [Marinomonas ostreistagni]